MKSKTTPAIMKMVVKVMMKSVASGQWSVVRKSGRSSLQLITGHWLLVTALRISLGQPF